MTTAGPVSRSRFFANNLSLQTMIVIALLMGLIVPLAATAVIDTESQRRVLLDALQQEEAKVTHVLSLGLQNPVWNLEPDSGRPLLNAVMTDPRIASISVTTPLAPQFLQIEDPGRRVGQSLVTEQPVMHGNEEIGRVRVEFTTGHMEADLADHRRRIIFALLLEVAVSTGIVLALLRGKVVAPIRSLVAQSKRYAAGDLTTGTDWDRGDEVGVLGRSMEDMRKSLLESFRALEQRNEELRESEAMNAGTIRSALDCIIMTDSEGRIIEFNPAAQKTFGFRQSEVVGKYVGDTIVPPHLRDMHNQGLGRYRATGQSKIMGRRIEIEAMKSDGTVFPVEIALSDLSVGTRRVFAAFIRDLSEQKEAEQEIARQREALYQSEKLTALGSLLAGVAHELNNPLSVVVGQAILLQEAAPDPKFAERAGKIRRAADRCARIVKTFLAMARSRPPETTSVRVNDIIMASVDIVSYGLRSAGIELSFDLDPDLPQVLADPDQLGNVFTNLIVNAQQALMEKQGGRELHVKSSFDPAAKTVRIAVVDNGPGIKPEIRSRIFEPFFTTKPTGIGTGIGLPLCHGIIRSHGGTLDVVDTPGGGATFVVTLPVSMAAVTTAKPDVVAPHGHHSILIVDDEPEIAETLADILRADGHTAEIAFSGHSAMERLETQDFEVILSDLRMPEMDGPALYRAIKERKPHLLKRIAFVTGDTLGRDVEGFLKEVGAPYLEKPFQPEEVRKLVADVVNGARAAAG
jgi:two-component system NtrC family sensor kinase